MLGGDEHPCDAGHFQSDQSTNQCQYAGGSGPADSSAPAPAAGGRDRRALGHGRRGGLLKIGQIAFQQLGHFVGRLEAIGGVLLVQPRNDPSQPIGNVWIDVTQWAGRVVADPSQHSHRALNGVLKPLLLNFDLTRRVRVFMLH